MEGSNKELLIKSGKNFRFFIMDLEKRGSTLTHNKTFKRHFLEKDSSF